MWRKDLKNDKKGKIGGKMGNKRILSLEELKQKGEYRGYFSSICPHLRFVGVDYWLCNRFDTHFGILAGKVVYKGKKDCLYRKICEGIGRGYGDIDEIDLLYRNKIYRLS